MRGEQSNQTDKEGELAGIASQSSFLAQSRHLTFVDEIIDSRIAQ